ncbi:MAG: hypothetical protein R2875_06505 [Desulfobacterales bacterium]
MGICRVMRFFGDGPGGALRTGVFETIRVDNGCPLFLEDHVLRVYRAWDVLHLDGKGPTADIGFVRKSMP